MTDDRELGSTFFPDVPAAIIDVNCDLERAIDIYDRDRPFRFTIQSPHVGCTITGWFQLGHMYWDDSGKSEVVVVIESVGPVEYS